MKDSKIKTKPSTALNTSYVASIQITGLEQIFDIIYSQMPSHHLRNKNK
jgi:hypothetical protein